MNIGSLLIALCVVASSVPAQVLLADDFEDGIPDGWTEYDGLFAVQGGEYVVTSTGPCNDARAVTGDPTWTDCAVDVDFFVDSTSSGAHAAVLFRLETIASGCDAGRYYQAHAFPDTAALCLMDFSSGNCTILTTQPASVPLQQWHNMRLEIEGSFLSMSIDGSEVLTYSGLDAYPAGRVGLKAINGYSVRYDNVVVSQWPGERPWSDQGCALAGSSGEPILAGTGDLSPGSDNAVVLTDAAPLKVAGLFVGAASTPLPFKGGFLKPYPFLPPIFLATSPSGVVAVPFVMPAGIPAGSEIWVQWAIQDAAALNGVALSNAILGVTP